MTRKWRGLVIDTPDPSGLASFYQELLGFDRIQDDNGLSIPVVPVHELLSATGR